MSAKNFFSEADKKEITDAIAGAELNTSGEIRVHIENKCKEDVLDHAAFIFEKLHIYCTCIAQVSTVLFSYFSWLVGGPNRAIIDVTLSDLRNRHFANI